MNTAETILPLILWPTIWGGIIYYYNTQLEVPPAIKKIADPRLRNIKYHEYINCYISFVHACFVILACGYAIAVAPWQLNRHFTFFEKMIMEVYSVISRALCATLSTIRYPASTTDSMISLSTYTML